MKARCSTSSRYLPGHDLLRRLLRYAAVAALMITGPSLPAAAAQKIGVFPRIQSQTGTDPGAGDYTDQYEAWLGRPMDYIVQFIPGETWASLKDGNNWFFKGWAPYAQSYRDRMVLSVPILPADGSTLVSGAGGAYNSHWSAFADMLVAKGYGNCVLRLGWEFNGNWYRWTTVGGKGPAFANYWIQIVNTMRSRPGANFKFCWNPVPGDPNGNGTPLSAFPGTGNQYVDFVGLDVYDTSITYYKNVVGTNPASYDAHFTSIANGGPALLNASQIQSCRTNGWKGNKEWGSYPLDWWSARVKDSTSVVYNLPICIPEWGLDTQLSPASMAGSGGRDNTYFLQQFYNWMSNANNKVDWAAYFEAGSGTSSRNHQICFSSQYPLAKALFPTLFGPNTLLDDDFADGNATGWTATPAANWSIVADTGDNAYKFDFDWNNQTGLSTAGSATWANYTLSTEFKITDFQAWSETRFFVRYVNSSNYYCLEVRENGGSRRLVLVRVASGVVTDLQTYYTTINPNTWYALTLTANGSSISATLNGTPAIQVTDTTLTTGMIGLGAWKQDVLFDNVIVE